MGKWGDLQRYRDAETFQIRIAECALCPPARSRFGEAGIVEWIELIQGQRNHGKKGLPIYGFGWEECLINTAMPTIIRIIGHQRDMSKRMGGSQPRLDRRKRIPNPIKMYAPIADLDLMMPPSLLSSPSKIASKHYF